VVDTGSPLEVRPAGEADRERWLEMRCRLWPQMTVERHDVEIGRVLANRLQRTAFIALRDGVAAGFVEISLGSSLRAWQNPPVACLEGLYVVPAHRGAGVARRLTAAAEDWAQARGCREILSEASADDASARAFHEHLGYQRRERIAVYGKPLAPRARSVAGEAPVEPGATTRPQADRARRGAWVVHGLVAAGGAWAMLESDLSSPEAVRGVLYPLAAAASVLYLLAVIAHRRYRRRTGERERSGELFTTTELPGARPTRAATGERDHEDGEPPGG